jgi:hypothetical protein
VVGALPSGQIDDVGGFEGGHWLPGCPSKVVIIGFSTHSTKGKHLLYKTDFRTQIQLFFFLS